MSQDFHAIFGLGDNDKALSTFDPAGVALAAIQELYKRSLELEEKTRQFEKQQREIAALKAAVASLETRAKVAMRE